MKRSALFFFIAALILIPIGCKKKEEFLYESAKTNYIQKVKSLIARGADINLQDEQGMRPLYLAFKYYHFEDITALLRKHGAKE